MGKICRDRHFHLFYNCIDLAQKRVIDVRHQHLGQPKILDFCSGSEIQWVQEISNPSASHLSHQVNSQPSTAATENALIPTRR
ncbi:hypothetical protein IQ270_03440 [Microcoleus sp. LEGE 07076]|uniref:hypothetical protein n=1 Tax=Microcoleus sp. LEGE 07076 TaxID=915322 RepID=UPI0018811A29|nr:hypothetical protein [Microcoleus sp. LEGE 07076]MBE9183802.1 hypothetical protein [Microcoleus sp. LEGE 07076]